MEWEKKGVVLSKVGKKLNSTDVKKSISRLGSTTVFVTGLIPYGICVCGGGGGGGGGDRDRYRGI